MLYLSRFSNPELRTGKYTAVRISIGAPRWSLGYTVIGAMKDLMPFGLLEVQDRALYEQKYRERLDRVGVDRILKQFDAYGYEKPIVLLCFEDVRDPEQWCHRSMFAQWWLEQTGEVVKELLDPSQTKFKHPQPMKAARKVASQNEKSAQDKIAARLRDLEEESLQLRMF